MLLPAQRQGFFFVFITWIRALACIPVISIVFYLFIGLGGCSVSPEISCGTSKLVRTPRIKKNIYIHTRLHGIFQRSKQGIPREVKFCVLKNTFFYMSCSYCGKTIRSMFLSSAVGRSCFPTR